MNFLIITCRRLAKEKFYSLLCIFSLALGFASTILISLYLLSEFTFDFYHEKHERIYRVNTGVADIKVSATGYEIGPLLVRDNPQFLDFVRLRQAFEKDFSYGDVSTDWEQVFLADATVFDIFTFEPVAGDIESAFQDQYSIAISESFAEFYFGSRDPIGELLSTEKFELRVSFVFEDQPDNVTQRFDALLPFELIETYEPDYLENYNSRFMLTPNTTFLYVAGNFDPVSMAAASSYLYNTYMADEAQARQTIGETPPVLFTAQKLSDIHFDETLLMDESTGNIVNMYIFAAIAIAVLVISCINYVNLATARAAARTKEVAMRKILGASAKNLVLQFLGESVIFITLAFGVGILLAALTIELGYVEDFTGKTDLASLILTPARLPVFILVGLGVGALSGIYPAWNLARQSMMDVFRPQPKSWRTGVSLRQLLVFVQMIASITIVTCVLIMLQQSSFLVETPLGFKKENQLVVRLHGVDTIRSREAIMTELVRHNEILSTVEMAGAIGRSLSVSVLPVEQNDGETRSFTTNFFNTGVGFLDTFEIPLLQGNMFRAEQLDSENSVVLVNETFVEQMEWNQPIGKKVGRSEIIGVIADFHYLPLHEPIASVFIQPYNDGFLDQLTGNRIETVSIDITMSVTGNNLPATREHIEQVVRQFSNQSIIEIYSLTEVWTRMYDDENQTIFLIGIFSGICIVISLLGLGGLASYTTQQRSKETAIRKVLGASVPSIITELSMNMIKVIGLAVFPAVIGAYYLSGIWLQRFSYRVDPSVTPYLQAIAIVSIFSIAILVLQTYRTAQANPVENLKYE